MLTIIILTIVGSIVASVVGTFWYSDKTPMGRIHMRSVGFFDLTPEEQQSKITEMKPKMKKMYIAQTALSLLLSFAVTFVVVTSIRNGVPVSLAIIFPVFTWLCYMVPVIGSGILWGNVSRDIAWKKFFSDASSNLVTVLIIAILAALFA